MSHNLGRIVADGRTFNQTAGLDSDSRPRSAWRSAIRHAALRFRASHRRRQIDGESGVRHRCVHCELRLRASGPDRSIPRSAPYPFASPAAPAVPDCSSTAAASRASPPGKPRAPLWAAGPIPTRSCRPTPIRSRSTRRGWSATRALHGETRPAPSPRFRIRSRTGSPRRWASSLRCMRVQVSSCTGTLIAADLFLTARHCLTDPPGEDVRSASVTFDYATCLQRQQTSRARHPFLQGRRGGCLRQPAHRVQPSGEFGLGGVAARRRTRRTAVTARDARLPR